MSRGASRGDYDQAFKDDKTFIRMVNDWAKTNKMAENKVKALVS